MNAPLYDCAIVGAGPAGLSAALILGRCRRRVLLCDDGRPRNWAAQMLHGFLTRDGTAPADFRCIAREQLRPYETVELRDVSVTDARLESGRFKLALAGDEGAACRKLLLATGVCDKLPELEGLLDCYGKSVFHCPYCDGWEHRDQALAVYGNGKSGAGLALLVSNWSRDVVLCTDGPSKLSRRDYMRLARRRIAVRAEPICRLEATAGKLERIVFAEGEPLPRQVLFVHTDQSQHADLAARLGCRIGLKKGSIDAHTLQSETVGGLYVAGDATRDVQLVIVAAAEGARAAFYINKALLEEDLIASFRAH